MKKQLRFLLLFCFMLLLVCALSGCLGGFLPTPVDSTPPKTSGSEPTSEPSGTTSTPTSEPSGTVSTPASEPSGTASTPATEPSGTASTPATEPSDTTASDTTQPSDTTASDTTTEPSITEPAKPVFDGVLTPYHIVYAAGNADNQAKAEALQQALAGKGIELSCHDDSVAAADPAYEILVGSTARYSLGTMELAEQDYCVFVSELRIVFLAGTDAKMQEAIDAFLADGLSNAGVCTLTASTPLTYHDDSYPTFTVGSGEAAYTPSFIYASEGTLKYAEKLQEMLLSNLGPYLPIVTEPVEDPDASAIRFLLDYNRFGGEYRIAPDGRDLIVGAPTETGMKFATDIFFTSVEEQLTFGDNNVTFTEDLHSTFMTDIETLEYSDKAQISGTTDKESFSYQIGDTIVFHLYLNLYYASGNVPVGCKEFRYTLTADYCEPLTGTAPGQSGEFVFTVPKEYVQNPGSVRLHVTAYGEDGKALQTNLVTTPNVTAGKTGNLAYIGGAIVDRENVTSATEMPEDFLEFWQARVDEVYNVNPKRLGKPAGSDSSNYYHYYKMDKEYIKNTPRLASKTDAEIADLLSKYDMYEVFLATPGKYPAVFYVSIGKNLEANSQRLSMNLNAYGCSTGYFSAPGNLTVAINPCGLPGVICKGDVNDLTPSYKASDFTATDYSEHAGFALNADDYDDPANAYLTEMLMRNIQVLRFLTNSYFTDGTPFAAFTEAFNGEIVLGGGSMGGFQSIGTAALVSLTQDKKPDYSKGCPIPQITQINVTCPWMCDPTGMAGKDDRIAGQGTRIDGINEGAAYLDSAHLATLLDCNVTVVGGFADTTCPSTGIIAFYNAIDTAYKKLTMVQNKDHSGNNPKTMIQDIHEERKLVN